MSQNLSFIIWYLQVCFRVYEVLSHDVHEQVLKRHKGKRLERQFFSSNQLRKFQREFAALQKPFMQKLLGAK